MIIVILVLLILVAYYVGRYAQWTIDAKRVMGSFKGRPLGSASVGSTTASALGEPTG